MVLFILFSAWNFPPESILFHGDGRNRINNAFLDFQQNYHVWGKEKRGLLVYLRRLREIDQLAVVYFGCCTK
jgi:hypothetical protein